MDEFVKLIKENWLLLLIIGIVLIALIIFLITFIVLKKKKNKKPRIVIDEAFISSLIDLYGGATNINEVNVENGRLKIAVNDLDIVNLNGIKGIAESGAVVTGNIIKTLYKQDSLTIKKALDKKI